jgi:hypothetical protein
MANDTPTDIVAGKAGGTAIVIKSSDLSTIFVVSIPCFKSYGRRDMNPIIDTIAIIPTKVNES